jgi:hypothetical protein
MELDIEEKIVAVAKLAESDDEEEENGSLLDLLEESHVDPEENPS